MGTGITAQDVSTEAETPTERGNLDGEEKAPRDCGGVRVVDKGNLRFSCKQKRGKGKKKTEQNGKQNMGNMAVTKKCKLSCGEMIDGEFVKSRKGRKSGTPKKIF